MDFAVSLAVRILVLSLHLIIRWGGGGGIPLSYRVLTHPGCCLVCALGSLDHSLSVLLFLILTVLIIP